MRLLKTGLSNREWGDVGRLRPNCSDGDTLRHIRVGNFFALPQFIPPVHSPNYKNITDVMSW